MRVGSEGGGEGEKNLRSKKVHKIRSGLWIANFWDARLKLSKKKSQHHMAYDIGLGVQTVPISVKL